VKVQFRFAALLIAQIAAAQTYTVLHTFTGADGAEPYGTPLVLDGITYGTTMSGGAYGAGTVYSWDGTTLTTLYSFGGFPGDGLNPMSGLAAGPGGLLYGTTTSGGANNAGTVYSVSLAGQEQVVLSLPTSSAYPTGGVTFDREVTNRLYSTTSQPGAIFSYNLQTSRFVNQDTSHPCLGTLTYYKGSMYGTNGKEVLAAKLPHRQRVARLVQSSISGVLPDGKGNFYGLTAGTGAGPNGSPRPGYIFKFALPTNGYVIPTTLHHFIGTDGGWARLAPLFMDANGNVYGTTPRGGGGYTTQETGNGVVFRLTPEGAYQLLYTFTGGADGGSPYAGVVSYPAGGMIGAASAGGDGFGVLYSIQ
jgi:uncharacterized repeat protein (TIGR03803 family)